MSADDEQLILNVRIGGTDNRIDSVQSFDPNTWYHVAVTCDGNSNTDFYIDGQNVATTIYAGSEGKWFDDIASVAELPAIGAMRRRIVQYYLDGSMDNVMIFDRELSEDEIQTLYNCGNLSYDEAGSLTEDQRGYEYEYDYENRIVKITKAGSDIAEFSYDALGRRIEKYASTHVVCPCAETVREAFLQLGAGSHFIKVLGPSMEVVKNCRKGPTFGMCPVMITGGMSLEKIEAAIEAGAVIIGTGFDLLLKNQSMDISSQKVTDILKQYINVVKESRAKNFSEMTEAIGRDSETWLNSLPHIHPFGK